MATRLYLTSKACGTYLIGPPLGDWSPGDSTRENRGQHHFTFLAAQAKTAGGVVNLSNAMQTFGAALSKSATNNQKLITYRWVSDLIAAPVTVSGTLIVTMCVQNTGDASSQLTTGQCYAYISQGDTMDERAVLVDNVTNATAWTATSTYRELTFAVTSGDALAGDRLVIEFGVNASPPTAPPGDTIFKVAYGTTDAAQATLADAVNGDTAARASWAEWSTDVTFQAAAAAPANDACADALVIASLPHESAVIDSTGSTDTDKGVWWTWTAPADMRVFVTAVGSNFYVWLRGWQGGCGALSLIQLHTTGSTNSFRAPWQGTGQSAIWFDAVSGTQYWFQLASTFAATGANALIGSNTGGAAQLRMYPYAAPTTGDLFVNCQKIVCYDGATYAVKMSQNDFYGLTPTNSCIDYTHRPLDNLNGGVSTGLRLYVDLFGNSPLVEILDLDTLNVGQSEIDFIFDALNYASNSENLASIVMGGTDDLHLGYFGDNYTVRGALSTPAQCRVNRLDATHADHQPGNPFPFAEAFTVAQDVGGSDYVELSNNHSTLFYTSAGTEIKTFELNTDTQGADFATLPAQSGSVPRPGARGVRLLYPYDGSGGAIVAYGNEVLRVDSAGTVVQSYAPLETELAQDLDKVELTPDALSFWVSDQYSCNLFKFELSSGTQTGRIETGLPPGQLCGFTIVGYRGQPTIYPDFEIEEEPRRWLRRAPILSSENRRFSFDLFRLDCQVGTGLASGAPEDVDPNVMMRISYDGGQTWSNERWRSVGRIGQYSTLVDWWRNGSGRNCVVEISGSSKTRWVLLDGYAQVTPSDDAPND